MQKLVSIIVPVYNVKKYLVKCVSSLINQTYKNIEILLIDDGSTDLSGSICDELLNTDPRIVVFHQKNLGLSAARNTGIKLAKGDFLVFVDSDDYVDEDMIQYLYELIEKFDCPMSICQHKIIGKKIIDLKVNKQPEVIDSVECTRKMLCRDIIDTSAWAKMYSAHLFDNVRYPLGKRYEDIATTYKLFIKSGKIAVGYESKYNYVYRSDSIVNSRFNEKKLELIEMTDKMSLDVLDKMPCLKNEVCARQVYSRISTINQMIGVKEKKELRKTFIEYIKRNKKIVLKNKNVLRCDKIAIRLLILNYHLYVIFWRLYLIIRKG